jgi:hypothetical protein
VQLTYQLHGAGGQTIGASAPLVQVLGTNAFEAAPQDLAKAADVEFTATAPNSTPTSCGTMKLGAPSQPPSAVTGTAGESSGAILDADLAATQWWVGGGRKDFLKASAPAFPKHTQFLVHGPSGAPIPPFPTAISEGDGQQIVILKDATATVPEVDIEIASCPSRELFRTKGSLPTIAGAQAGFYVAVPIGSTLGCGAGNLIYSVSVKKEGGATTAHSVRVRVSEVYHVAATVFYGFDFVRQPTFAAPDKLITRTEDRVGPGFRLGFTWFPFGIDYEHMKWYNHVLNPFGAFDPASPKDSFIVGTNFTPHGGMSLAVGVAVHHLPVLNGVALGSTFSGPGDVPTRKEWNRAGLGLYVGVAMDTNVLTALKGMLASTKAK